MADIHELFLLTAAKQQRLPNTVVAPATINTCCADMSAHYHCCLAVTAVEQASMQHAR
jgi:hypothetical protein